MRLRALLVLLLPVVCLSFSPPRNPKTASLEISSKDNQPSDASLTQPTTDVAIPKTQPREKVLVIVKGRKWKNKRQKCLNGSKSKKCKKMLRKMARKEKRKIKRHRIAAANPPTATRFQFQRRPKGRRKLKLLLAQCRRKNRRGIESAVVRCAEDAQIDVDTFMDFALLVLSNSSLSDKEPEYPEDELKEIQDILFCLGNRKRWHRADNVEDVLGELRIKQAFASIDFCVNEVGRNCSWQQEQASDWLNCVEVHCKERRYAQAPSPPAIEPPWNTLPETTSSASVQPEDVENGIPESTETPQDEFYESNIDPNDYPGYDYSYIDEDGPPFKPDPEEEEFERRNEFADY